LRKKSVTRSAAANEQQNTAMQQQLSLTERVAIAAQWIAGADSLLITAGAGIGVDSGLPDFRGDSGFWEAYPALARGKIRFQQIANGTGFDSDPLRAWGFYGHRLQLYRDTVPHAGFRILRRFADAMAAGAFIFTSNVDGQFQRAGFAEERIEECHGSIHHLQCNAACMPAIWPATELVVEIDAEACEWKGALPRCPHCGALARPNILMFNDWNWFSDRTDRQSLARVRWLRTAARPVVIELGAGTAIPTVRLLGESQRGPLIRINPREAQTDGEQQIGLAVGALQGLQLIEAQLERMGRL